MRKFAEWFLKGLIKMKMNNNLSLVEGLLACIIVFSISFFGLYYGIPQ